MYPALWSVPVATRSSLENWAHETVTTSPLRQYLLKQMDDMNSGIWEYFDRGNVINFFNSLSSSSGSTSMSRYIIMYLQSSVKVMLFSSLPRLATRIQAHRFRSLCMPHEVLMRFMVLKDWHDKFISGHRSH
jgi:hypothetical protein